MNQGAYQGFARGNVKGSLEKMCFEMSLKRGKGLGITSDAACGVPDMQLVQKNGKQKK